MAYMNTICLQCTSCTFLGFEFFINEKLDTVWNH